MTLGLVPRPAPALQVRDDVSPLESIHMIDAEIGWASTTLCEPCPPYVLSGLMLRTTSGGTQWKDVTPVDASGQRISVFHFYAFNSHIAWVMSAGTGTTTIEVFRTVDGGRTWKGIAIPAPSARSISFINLREGWLLAPLVGYTGHEDVDIYRSTDGGEAWIKVASATSYNVSSGLPNTGGKANITFLNSKTGWIAGITGLPNVLYLYVTGDGGRTWRQQGMPLPRELTPHWMGSPQPPPRFFTARDGILPVFFTLLNDSGEQTGRLVALYSTHDGGTTWTYTAPVPINMSDLAYPVVADLNHAWVLNGGVLRATSDGGRRWTTMPLNSLFADVTQLNFVSPQVGWAVRQTMKFVSPYRSTFPFLLKTLDGGRTWTSVLYTILRE